MAERLKIDSGAPWESRVGYSRAVRVGKQIWVSGSTPIDADGKVVAVGDPYEQTRQTLANIAAALERAGASMADVVRTRMYATEISHWEAIGRAHGEVFAEIRPATTLVEVSALIDPAMLIEIEAEAIVD